LPPEEQVRVLALPELQEQRQLPVENRKPKLLVADLTLDRSFLQECLGKKF
jgi:hypothetical protein